MLNPNLASISFHNIRFLGYIRAKDGFLKRRDDMYDMLEQKSLV